MKASAVQAYLAAAKQSAETNSIDINEVTIGDLTASMEEGVEERLINGLGTEVMDYLGDVGLGEILLSGVEGDVGCRR